MEPHLTPAELAEAWAVERAARAERLTSVRLTELADEFEAQLAREAHGPADLMNALDVIALTFQVRVDEIKAEIAAQS
jgi:hypothetical protein